MSGIHPHVSIEEERSRATFFISCIPSAIWCCCRCHIRKQLFVKYFFGYLCFNNYIGIFLDFITAVKYNYISLFCIPFGSSLYNKFYVNMRFRISQIINQNMFKFLPVFLFRCYINQFSSCIVFDFIHNGILSQSPADTHSPEVFYSCLVTTYKKRGIFICRSPFWP